MESPTEEGTFYNQLRRWRTFMNVQVTTLQQEDPITETTATVRIAFSLLGLPPDIVEVYASPDLASIHDRGNIAAIVEVELPELKYEETLTLRAGLLYFISVCPRTVSEGTVDDRIEGEDWQAYCQGFQIVTRAKPTPPPPQPVKAHPRITNFETFPATLKRRNGIKVSWQGSARFEYFIIKWDCDRTPDGYSRERYNLLHSQVDVEQSGKSGSFVMDGAVPGFEYAFSVDGCDTDIFGTSNCSGWSPLFQVVAQKNLNSLRQYLELSGENPAAGVRRLLPNRSGSLRRFMQLG
jgi:hypothetical protein